MSVTTKHQEYIDYKYTWETLRAAYVGSGAIKTAPDRRVEVRGVRMAGTKYLPRPLGMVRDEQYAAYRDRASWYAATERTVQGLTGAIFRREPVIEAPAILTPQLEDITQTGVPLRTFAERVVRETLLMGRFGVLVDFPQPVMALPGAGSPGARRFLHAGAEQHDCKGDRRESRFSRCDPAHTWSAIWICEHADSDAVGVAALLAGKVPVQPADTVTVVVSGGNVATEIASAILGSNEGRNPS